MIPVRRTLLLGSARQRVVPQTRGPAPLRNPPQLKCSFHPKTGESATLVRPPGQGSQSERRQSISRSACRARSPPSTGSGRTGRRRRCACGLRQPCRAPKGCNQRRSTRRSTAQGGREKRPVSRSQAPSSAPSQGGETEPGQLPARQRPSGARDLVDTEAEVVVEVEVELAGEVLVEEEGGVAARLEPGVDGRVDLRRTRRPALLELAVQGD